MKTEFVCLAILSAVLGCGSDTDRALVVIDSVPQGSEVYIGGLRLGVTPLELRDGGIFDPGWTYDQRSVDLDGYLEYAELGAMGQPVHRLTFLSPPSVREGLLSAETTWGPRTKITGLSHERGGEADRVVVEFASAVDQDGIRLALQPIANAEPSSEVVLSATITNTGGGDLHGRSPELVALWGGSQTPWDQRSCTAEELPATFDNLPAGSTKNVELRFRAPDVAGDYSVFLLFHLDSVPGSPELNIGSVYSESRLLRVREQSREQSVAPKPPSEAS